MAHAGQVLVTGAAGFVGRHLLHQLIEDGTSIVAWHRPGGTAPRLREDVRWMAVELLDRDAVVRAIDDVRPSAVYHLAGAAHVAQSWRFTLETYQNNVLATHHLFEALHRTGVAPRVLVTCSATVYRAQPRPITEADPLAPSSPYATSKLAQEMLAIRVARDNGIPALVARAFNHTGPGQSAGYVASSIARQIARIEAGLQEPVLKVGNLNPKRDLTDVRDTVRAYTAMMARATPGVPYNVCSGRALSIRELVRTFVARSTTPLRIEQDAALFRPNDTPLLVGSHDRLTADTGWRPVIPLERTVDDLLNDWRARVRDEAEEQTG